MDLYVIALFSFLFIISTTAKEYCVQRDSEPLRSSEKIIGSSEKIVGSLNCNDNVNLKNLTTANISSNTAILFSPGQHYLPSVWTIENISNLNMFSMSEIAIVTCTANESGIFFMNVSNLTLERLEFRQCGITGNTTYANRAALVFYHSLNMTLIGIIIEEPGDAGGFSLNHMRGKILVRDSLFKNSRLSKKGVTSGNFIGHEENLQQKTEVVILNTTFENNSYILNPKCQHYRDRRLSAGLAMVLTLGNIAVNLNHVTLRDNSGCGGGNLAVLLYQNLTNHNKSSVSVTISNNSIIEGGYANVGGGILIILNWQKFFNNFTISDTTIVDNRAMYDGGGMFIKITQAIDLRHSSLVSISGCHFERNKLDQINANGGYALQVTTFFRKGFEFHRSPQLKVAIASTKFINHYHDHDYQKRPGNAVLYLKNSPFISVRDIVITNNTCSGITAIASNVILAGNVSISNNKAYSGGGIHLCSDALLYFNHTLLSITNNSANYTGGGINVESGCTLNSPACFYQFYNSGFDNTSKAIVEGNTAKYAGDNIYGGAIQECYLIEGHQIHGSVFNKLFQVPENLSPKFSSISSLPRGLNLSFCNAEYNNETIPIYPGQSVEFNATIFGQNSGVTPGTVYGSLSDSKRVFLRRGDDIQTLVYKENSSSGFISYRFYSTKQGSFSLTLKVSEGSTDPHTQIRVVRFLLLSCPLGLEINSKGKQSACLCAYLKKINSHTRHISCAISKSQKIEYNPELWIGSIPSMNVSQVIAVAIVCPQDYCLNQRVILNLTKNPFDDNAEQCNFNRSGVLCGKCIHGRSVILGSSECRICSNYYLFLLLLFVLAGPALVFVISLLNLTVSSATLNGIIFYANIVQIHGLSLFSDKTVIFKIFISWLNLDFGISTCLFDGMDGFSKALLQFVFPIYLWIIAGIVIWLSKRFKVIVNLFGTNLVQVLATLILLSYTKLIRAAIDAVMFTKLIIPKAPHSPGYLRWSIDGNLQFLEGKHIIIFTVGVIFGLLSLPYLLILACIGQLPRISHWPFFSWINKLKPFFDCYTGPLSSKGRFWVGLLLAVRVFLLIIYSINISSAKVSKMTTTIVVVMVLLLLSLASPKGIYNKYHLNVLEILSIVNLGVLFSGLLCSYHYEMEIVKDLFVILSLGVCILLFSLIIAIHINQRFGCFKILKWLQTRSQSLANRHNDDSDRIVTHCSLRIPPYQFESETERLLPSHD